MSGSIPVSDLLSNLSDQVVNSAKLMSKSPQRQSIFEAVYKNQQQEKGVREIMATTGLTQIRVLNEGKKLGPLLVKVRGGFRKKKELAPHYKKILALARDKKKLDRVPTKVSPKFNNGGLRVSVVFSSNANKATPITIEDIDSFAKAKKRAPRLGRVREDLIKKAFASIAGEGGVFKDWGGEKSDLYTNKLRVKGNRRATAIAFKGIGTSSKLVPAKMGKNGDQIDRLFSEPAEVFLVVYCGQIDSAIISQMQAFAIAKKAMLGNKVYFGVIDADDLGRLAAGYPEAFR
jgi:hypothetical protein